MMKRNEWKKIKGWDLSQKAYYKLFKHKYMHKYAGLVNRWENWDRFFLKMLFFCFCIHITFTFQLSLNFFAVFVELMDILCFVVLRSVLFLWLWVVNVLFLKKGNGICKKARSNYDFHWNKYCQSLTTADRLGEENIYLEYLMEKGTYFSQFNLISPRYMSRIMDGVLLRLLKIRFNWNSNTEVKNCDC